MNPLQKLPKCCIAPVLQRRRTEDKQIGMKKIEPTIYEDFLVFCSQCHPLLCQIKVLLDVNL